MKISHNYSKLIKKYPFFIYESFSVNEFDTEIIITFHFNIADHFHFYPTITIPKNEHIKEPTLSKSQWNNFAFNMGMIEAISYWKSTCSPQFIVKPYHFNKEQIEWWKKIYFHGLGEFFYQNKIESVNISNFMQIESSEIEIPNIDTLSTNDAVIVPIGGGKDSTVTIELLKKSNLKLIPFAINPRKAIKDTITNAGFKLSDAFFIQRSIDKKLLDLNAQGFLNGHTPFSAMVAFTTLLIAALCKVKHIALSNESSASEATIPNTKINHQYSKSFEFESDFRNYYQQYITKDLNYFSFLRPLNELQIAKMFSRLTHHHSTFRSCNKGSKENCWCGKCSKCLFTAYILSPFLHQRDIIKIFDKDILNDKTLLETAKELSGNSDKKPFECVGTIDDVNAAIHMAKNKWNPPLPYLINEMDTDIQRDKIDNMLNYLNQEHFLNDNFFKILKNEL